MWLDEFQDEFIYYNQREIDRISYSPLRHEEIDEFTFFLTEYKIKFMLLCDLPDFIYPIYISLTHERKYLHWASLLTIHSISQTVLA